MWPLYGWEWFDDRKRPLWLMLIDSAVQGWQCLKVMAQPPVVRGLLCSQFGVIVL